MKKQSKQKSTRVRVGKAEISHPPQIQEYAVRHGTRLRFVAGSALEQQITYQNLLDTMLMATTTTQLADVFTSVKVRKVEVWAAPLLGSAVSVSVAFDSAVAGNLGDQRLHTDTSMGIQPAHVSARPSPKAQAAQFQPSSVSNAFFLTCPSGSVIDVELTFVQSSVTGAMIAQNVGVALTVGAPYWRGLDGLAAATSKLLPVALSVA